MRLEIDEARLSRELDELAQFSAAPAPAVTRVVYSPEERAARAYVKQLCRRLNLEVRDDAVGNTFARLPGSEPALPAIATGSHIDAIPNAGRFDGTVGVLGGLAAIRAIKAADLRPRRSIELIVFAAEEPTRFGIGCFSSRMLAGTLTAEAAAGLRDRVGRTLDELRAEAGYTAPLDSVRLPEGHYGAFLELHIEQGPRLDRSGTKVGIVTAIAAPASLRIEVEGEGGHAGAVLMAERRDALCAAAEIVLAAETAAKASGARDTVATIGMCDVFPGAVNSIPSRVTLSLDVRDIDEGRRDGVLAAIAEACEETAARRGVEARTAVINKDAPAACDSRVMNALTMGVARQNRAHIRMVSRAYHDALFMARIAPTGMLFIPCRDGVSHRPDEYASPEDIAIGATVLAEALAELANYPE
jgi:ureidoglycolate amidohydrolase